MPKSVQIASAVAYATAHEACAAHAKTRLAAPLRSFAAPLRSPTVFLRVQHMASCAARTVFLVPYRPLGKSRFSCDLGVSWATETSLRYAKAVVVHVQALTRLNAQNSCVKRAEIKPLGRRLL